MQTTYDFLEALGLDQGAQERDIRRAYARKLKQIDQETDPDAFQALRAAYEVALDWARWKLAQVGDEASPGTPTKDAPPGPAAANAPAPAEAAPAAALDAAPQQATPAQLGAQVYHRFLADAAELVTLPKHGEPAAWRAAIEARFQDEEMVNIDARIYFEAYIASLLASGWRPGHEVLFVAAQQAFAWTDDRRGLRQLGPAGRMLDQAIEERRLFEAQETTERARMRDLVKMLRQEELPATRRIRAAMPDVERMLGRFSAFMEVVASMENVERWRTIYRESGGPPVAVAAVADIAGSVAVPEPKRTFSTLQGTVLVLALFAVLRAMFNYSGGEHGSGSGGFHPPAAQQPVTQAVPQEVLDSVVPPVRYTPPPGSSLHKLDVVHKVFLTFDNKIERVQNWQTSGEPGFDQAVGDALRAAKPFPPGTPREFEVRYTGTMVHEGGPRAAAGQPKTAPAARPTPVPLTLEMLRKHLPPVQFKPAADAKPGDYTGTYKVTLDPAGKVLGVDVVRSSGLPALDRAVRKAVRKAKPFAPGTSGFQFSFGTTITREPSPSSEQPQAESREAIPPDTGVE